MYVGLKLKFLKLLTLIYLINITLNLKISTKQKNLIYLLIVHLLLINMDLSLKKSTKVSLISDEHENILGVFIPPKCEARA